MTYGDAPCRPCGDSAIRAIGLRKSFDGHEALSDFNLTVPLGTVFGLLGPNGAGKSTAVRILTTLLRPDSGEAHVAGFDVARHPLQVRQRIGLVGQHASLDEVLSGRENLIMFGRLLNLTGDEARTRADQLLEQFDLASGADKSVADYSGGMRRRLDLAASLIVGPTVLFLDEPTTGLDPKARLDLWTAIKAVVSTGTTILLTTQYMEEADQLCDEIAVVDAGRIVAQGTPDQLKAKVGPDRVETITRKPTLDEVFLHLTGHRPATIATTPAEAAAQ